VVSSPVQYQRGRRGKLSANARTAFVVSSGRKSESPLISVVISTRNHAHWLGEAVRAILAQDIDADFELIVCDDASTDHTQAVMQGVVQDARRPVTYIRLAERVGPAQGRNVALGFAKGEFIAFTDSDCVPSPGWLRAAIRAFATEDVGIVQGRTQPTRARVPFFAHHIETKQLDGTFATANILYRQRALAAHRFDPACWSPNWTWEDSDLGWRVQADGWRAAFASDAVVAHQVVPLSPIAWMLWPTRFQKWPEISAHHPGFRQHLFLGIWARPLHLLFQLALVGVVIAWWQPTALVLTLPYVMTFGRVRGIGGRFPPAKVASYLVWDCVAFVTLVVASIRYRSLVL